MNSGHIINIIVKIFRNMMAVFVLLTPGLTSNCQTVGANFNKSPEDINFEYLEKTNTQWIRATINYFWYFNGERNVRSDEGMIKIRQAKENGYKIIFGFRWDFAEEGMRIPLPDSEEEKAYFNFADSILMIMAPSCDIIVTGNEPIVETADEDELYNESFQGIPLVIFTERFLNRILDFLDKNPDLGKPGIYAGSINALFSAPKQNNEAVRGLLKLANDHPGLRGIDLHLHVNEMDDVDLAMEFARDLMPVKDIIVTEFSLNRMYKDHLNDLMGIDEKGKLFCDSYDRPYSQKLFEWFSDANANRVNREEWLDMFLSRSWYPENYLVKFHDRFREYGVVHSTYAYLQTSAPVNMTAESQTWFANPVYLGVTLEKTSGEEFVPNPLCYPDYLSLQEPGNTKDDLATPTFENQYFDLIYSDGSYRLQLFKKAWILSCELYSMNGQLIRKYPSSFFPGQAISMPADYGSGMYVVRLKTGEWTATKKFIHQTK